MNIKIGYYPLLDAALTLRQAYSVERFRPFSPALEAVYTRLSSEDKEKIAAAAPMTQDWLDVIQRLIDLTLTGMVSPEEILIEADKCPSFLFGPEATAEMTALLADIWYNHCFAEMTKYASQIRRKTAEIAAFPTEQALLDYILGLSDRIEKVGSDTLKFNIKPDMSVKLRDIENIIVMPSVFSCRNVTFWHSGSTFLFYVALDSKALTLEEPSDMLLLRTLAFNDKTRLKMLKSLAASALSVNDMAELMKVNASTVSRHFKVFKDAGYVDIQSQEGNSIYYSLNEKEIKKAMDTIYNYIFRRDEP